MSGRQALADATRTAAWNTEQKAALRAAFTSLAEVLDRLILLKGRVVTQPVSMDTLPVTFSLPFAGRPAAILVLSATRTSDGATISAPPILWKYTPTLTQNTAQIVDIDLDAGFQYEATILIVETVT